MNAAVLALWGAVAWGSDRSHVRYGIADGLQTDPVEDVVQDELGRIWVGTHAGVARFDGGRFDPVATDTLDRRIHRLAAGVGDEVYAVDTRWRIWRFDGDRAAHIEGPYDPAPIAPTVDERGRLWFADGAGEVYRRDVDGTWSRPMDGIDAGRASLVVADPGRPVLVGTDQAVWAQDTDGWTRLADGGWFNDLELLEDGTLWTLQSFAAAEAWREGERIYRAPYEGSWDRAISLAGRGSTMWVMYARQLIEIRQDRSVERVEPIHLRWGGPMIVDHEGSLWAASRVGLHRYPEPSTLRLQERDLVPSAHFRCVVADGPDRVWASTWQGLTRLDHIGGTWVSEAPGPTMRDQICRTPDGSVWGSTGERELVRVHPDGAVETVLERYVPTCAEDPERGLAWFVTGGALVVASETGTRTLPAPADAYALAIEGEGAWLLTYSSVCRAPVEALLEGADRWTCKPHEAAEEPWDIEVADGVVWTVFKDAGLRHWDGQLSPVPGVSPGERVDRISRSPRGGIWLTLPGRIERWDPGAQALLEELSAWHGLLGASPAHVDETQEGDIWVVGPGAAWRIPESARTPPEGEPGVRIFQATVNGQSVSTGSGLEVPAGPNHVVLRFLAPSYRDPARVRYRVSIDGTEERELRTPSLDLIDLSPGLHRLAVTASLDGQTWSAPDRVEIRVLRLWYRSPWFFAALGLVFVSAGGGLFQIRLWQQRQLAAQRDRIAQDLHDDIGSGLGSIGLLASVLESPEIADGERLELSQEIANTASTLGTELRQIVRTLKPERRTAADLVQQLRIRGQRLFPTAGDVVFSVVVPERIPGRELSIAVRRNTELIALEALHNAAKHAGASSVELGFEFTGRRWRIWVQDDGRGFSGRPGGGMGLDGMERRAEAIGAQVAVDSRPGRGTRIELRFDSTH